MEQQQPKMVTVELRADYLEGLARGFFSQKMRAKKDGAPLVERGRFLWVDQKTAGEYCKMC